MTTAPTNEMLALADELDTKLPVFHGRERDLIVRVITALRLAATPSARDVREACKQAAILRATRCSKDLATPPNIRGLGPDNNALGYGKRVAFDIAKAIDDLNLDAAAPAAGGDDLSLGLMQARYVLRNLHNERPGCGYDKLAAVCEKAAFAPPLQAPAHSDAVRGYTLLVELLGEYARDLRRNSSGGDDYPWDWASAVADQLDMLIQRSQFTQDDFYRTDETLSEHDRAKIEELVASYETPNPVAKVINNNKPGNTSIIEVLKTPPTLDVGTLLYAVPVRKTSHISYAPAAKALSEAEAEIARLKEVDSTFNELASYSNTLAARAEAAESRLAEAMKVIERLIKHADDFQTFGPAVRDARRFLNAGKE